LWFCPRLALGKKHEILAGRVALVVERSPSKDEALSSKPSTTKQNKTTKKTPRDPA
jgi:hypothetical protein